MGESVMNYAAPIQSPTQQYQLAIQHHRNDEARHFIQSGQIQMGNVTECGLADIHVACRFNNRLILELIISQGLGINLPDKAGNTPLHYASKFGNIDICRYLVALNCLTGIRNASGQSPYDVAESHTVRQFLLPLQFREEANHPDAIAQQSQPQDPFALGGRSSVPTNVAPPPVYPMASGCYSGQQQGYLPQNRYVAYPGMVEDVSNNITQQSTTSVPQPQQQFMYTAHPPAAVGQFNPPSATRSTVSHIIQPDGFGSSQTDVRLQQKYGNVKEQVYIAPPPLGGMSQPDMTRSISCPQYSPAPLPLPLPLPPPPAMSSAQPPAPSARLSEIISAEQLGSHSAPSSNSGRMFCPPGPSVAPSATLPASSPLLADAPMSAPSATTYSTTSSPFAPSSMIKSSSSSSIIKPDGFGSSQTDVRLQQKYGNVKEQVYISPPPLGGVGVGMAGGSPRINSQAPYGVPPAMYQPQQQMQVPQPSSMSSAPPPLPYASAARRTGATQSQGSGNGTSEFSTIDLDSNSSAMM